MATCRRPSRAHARRQRGWLTDYLWEKEPETKGGHSVTKASHRIPKTAILSQRESYFFLSVYACALHV